MGAEGTEESCSSKHGGGAGQIRARLMQKCGNRRQRSRRSRTILSGAAAMSRLEGCVCLYFTRAGSQKSCTQQQRSELDVLVAPVVQGCDAFVTFSQNLLPIHFCLYTLRVRLRVYSFPY